MNRKMLHVIQDYIEKNPHEVKILVHLLLVSRHLERIADQATNIAEDVIYMIEGIIIRHHAEDYTSHD
jgi:phosphate transport system protein